MTALPSHAGSLTQPLALLECLLHCLAGGPIPVAHAAPVLDGVGVDLVVAAHVLKHKSAYGSDSRPNLLFQGPWFLATRGS